MNTIEKGVLGEKRVEARLIEREYIVSDSMEGAPYDLVADDGYSMYKVQVKTVSNTEEFAEISLRRISHNTKERKTSQYSDNEVDVYCIYAIDRDEVYWIPFDVAPSTCITLRWTEPINGQTSGVHMADDYCV